MGDRGVIELTGHHGQSQDIFFYTHWSASRLPELVAEGLDRGSSRWGDESYLNRIIFDSLTGLSGETTGFGISPWCPEDAWLKVSIDHAGQTVQVLHNELGGSVWLPATEPLSFAEFVEAYKK